jgi:hypothetical protein
MRWRLRRLPRHEALDVAVIMNARGVMEMVWLAQLHAGLVDAKPFFRAARHGVVDHAIDAGDPQGLDGESDVARDGQRRHKFVGRFGQS